MNLNPRILGLHSSFHINHKTGITLLTLREGGLTSTPSLRTELSDLETLVIMSLYNKAHKALIDSRSI